MMIMVMTCTAQITALLGTSHILRKVVCLSAGGKSRDVSKNTQQEMKAGENLTNNNNHNHNRPIINIASKSEKPNGTLE